MSFHVPPHFELSSSRSGRFSKARIDLRRLCVAGVALPAHPGGAVGELHTLQSFGVGEATVGATRSKSGPRQTFPKDWLLWPVTRRIPEWLGILERLLLRRTGLLECLSWSARIGGENGLGVCCCSKEEPLLQLLVNISNGDGHTVARLCKRQDVMVAVVAGGAGKNGPQKNQQETCPGLIRTLLAMALTIQLLL
jgi:hypothetical protein